MDRELVLVICVTFLLMFCGGAVFISVLAQKQKRKDDMEPIKKRYARVVDRPQAIRGEMIVQGPIPGPIVFEFDNGERIQLIVKGSEYATILVGDVGELTYQGSRFIGFKRG